jgi:hypothetical protein
LHTFFKILKIARFKATVLQTGELSTVCKTDYFDLEDSAKTRRQNGPGG